MRLSFIQGFFYILLLVICSQQGFSQMAKIEGTVKNTPNGKLFLVRPAYAFTRNNVYMGRKEVLLNDKGEFDMTVDLYEPEIMKAFLVDSGGNHLADYNFYLSPGDHLKMEKDGKLAGNNFKVTGKGANNNQPLAIDANDSIGNFYGDTLPGRAITYLGSQHKLHKRILEEYIKKNKPSAGFVTAWKANLQYEMLDTYFFFSTNNAFQVWEQYKRTHDKWDAVKGSLFISAPLLNEQALVATTYKNFLRTYLGRTKENLWDEYKNHRPGFLLEWYGKDTAAGAKLFAEDQSNDLQQRIIERNFTGKMKEYLYAVLINGALGDREIKNLNTVYRQFRSQFPSSKYLGLFEEPMKEMAYKQERKLTPAMKFIDAAQFKTWEDVLAYFKGKTVLLDMWGTWCGPCRQDLDKHSAFIKEHFKDKPLEYFYIANFDTEHEEHWKELIAYFNLGGYHIIAPKELTKDIMSKVKGQGYPTYVIIHKDGSFEQYERGYGIDREVLIPQLEAALAH